MRYEYTITKEMKDGDEPEIMHAMSWKKLFKSLLLKYPKFSGWASYFNKKGHQQVKVINEGKIINQPKRN
jgi:peptide methionine sulfoxide reductase MsrB